MKACPSCATELPEDARFCGSCGYRFEASATPAPAPAAAPPAPSPAPATPSARTPSQAAAFALTEADFAKAFERVCESLDLPAPAKAPHDHQTLFAAAQAAGIDKLTVEKALHRVSIEKLPEEQRRKMGIVLEEDIEPQGRPAWLVPVVAANVLALLVVVLVLVLRDDTPVRPPVELKAQQGTIDVDALNTSLDELAGKARACYQAALVEQKNLKGDVVITLRIGLEGKAEAPSLSVDNLQSSAAAACIVGAAAGQAFPAAQVAPVDVDVPLTFAPGD